MSNKFRYSEYYKMKIAKKKALEREKQFKELQVLPSDREILEKIKKEIKEDYTSTVDFLAIPTHIKILKTLFTIVIFLIILFILYKNFISAEQFNYFYDIGSQGESYLSPSYRISEPSITDNMSYRNLTSGLVYFTAPIPRGAEKLNIDIYFRDNFSQSLLILGAKDEEQWHYQWKTFFSKLIENISSEITPVSEGNIQVYRINPDTKEKNFSDLKNSNGLIIASSVQLNNTPNRVGFSKEITTINNSLRAGHTFYIYTAGDLELNVKKQDINWYNGSDELKISLYDSKGDLIENTTIPDDGIILAEPDRQSRNIQNETLSLKNLPEGVYKIVFSDFDGLIREIKINTDKIVVADKIYLADSNIFFNNLEKPSFLYTGFYKNTSLSFQTWHNQGFQTILVNNKQLKIRERVNKTAFNAEPGNYTIKINKNDLIISATGYFAFSKENYFEPFANRIIPFKTDYNWLNDEVDYIVLNYNPPTSKKGEWLVGHASFDIKDLYVKDNKLSLVLNTPHLAKEQYKNYTIPIDWINITIYKPGLNLSK